MPKVTLTYDQISVILEALEDFDVDRLKLWELDEFDSGTDKEDYFVRLEEVLNEARGY